MGPAVATHKQEFLTAGVEGRSGSEDRWRSNRRVAADTMEVMGEEPWSWCAGCFLFFSSCPICLYCEAKVQHMLSCAHRHMSSRW
jgi:hypothetical protein